MCFAKITKETIKIHGAKNIGGTNPICYRKMNCEELLIKG